MINGVSADAIRIRLRTLKRYHGVAIELARYMP